jgi:hypothetical protein
LQKYLVGEQISIVLVYNRVSWVRERFEVYYMFSLKVKVNIYTNFVCWMILSDVTSMFSKLTIFWQRGTPEDV